MSLLYFSEFVFYHYRLVRQVRKLKFSEHIFHGSVLCFLSLLFFVPSTIVLSALRSAAVVDFVVFGRQQGKTDVCWSLLLLEDSYYAVFIGNHILNRTPSPYQGYSPLMILV